MPRMHACLPRPRRAISRGKVAPYPQAVSTQDKLFGIPNNFPCGEVAAEQVTADGLFEAEKPEALKQRDQMFSGLREI
jgi:hypothetical protein